MCKAAKIFPRLCLTWLLCGLIVITATCPAFAADKYVFILKWIGNPYWQALKQGIDDAGKRLGIEAVVLTPVSDQAKEEHLNLCQAAISQKPKLIALGPATTAIGIECFREAQKQGIKVADIDATVSAQDARKANVDLAFTIGADNTVIGERAASFVAEHSKKATAKILVLEGVVGSPPSTDRVAGFKNGIKKLLPQATIVNSISAEWDRLRALNITADTLMRAPDLDVIFAANDVMALGAVEAIRTAGKNGQVMVVGVDGVPDARAAIKQGKMTASITQLPYWIGKRAVEKAIDSVSGKPVKQTERAPLVVLTKKVLDANQDPLLQYVR
jgi:D-allose transport system substrate-binding protein